MPDDLEPHRAAGLANLRNELQRQGISVRRLHQMTGLSRALLQAMVAGHRSGREFFGSHRSQARVAEVLGADPGLFFPRTQTELDRAEGALMGPCS